MPLVFAGVCSHAPGITGRSEQADPDVRNRFYAAFDQMRIDLEASRPDAVVIVAAERAPFPCLNHDSLMHTHNPQLAYVRHSVSEPSVPMCFP